MLKQKERKERVKMLKKWMCVHCNKTYVRLNNWMHKHFDKKHPGKNKKAKNILTQRMKW